MKRTCLECSALIRGRSDKKFCDDACRNAYNNRQNRISNNRIRNVNRILGKNRRILTNLNPDGRSRTTRDALTRRGFNFHYFTGISRWCGKRYYWVYEQGFHCIDGHHIDLTEKKDEVELQSQES